MNAKIPIVFALALLVAGTGFSILADADDSAAIDDGNTYPVVHKQQVNMSDLFLIIQAILVVAGIICIAIAVYVQIYGDY